MHSAILVGRIEVGRRVLLSLRGITRLLALRVLTAIYSAVLANLSISRERGCYHRAAS